MTAPREAPIADSTRPAAPEAPLAPLILVVDDEPGICEANEVLLADLGYRTVTALTGHDAIRLAHEHRPDLILLDVTMPGQDGFDTCRALRSDEATADIPIVFVTAREQASHKVRAFDLGASDYITKPFDERELVARVGAHLVRRARTAEALEASARACRALREELLQAGKLASLGQLLSGVAHELNNPLTAILGYADLIAARARQGGDAALLEECRKLGAVADRAARIVRNVLGFARKREADSRPIDLNEVVRAALELESAEMVLEGVALEPTLGGGLPPVQGDPALLEQVVLNLVTNARQALAAAQRADGRVAVRTAAAAGGGVRLEVEDNGPGIPSGQLERIFDPFFTTKPEGQGTGLGLSLCLDVVRQHGGRIRAESPPGRGARFVVELPPAPQAGAPTPGIVSPEK